MPRENIHSGHRRRLKDEFQKLGADHFPSHKLLELLLFYAVPRKDTNEIAHDLIDRFGSISGVLSAPIKLLEMIPGIGMQTAVFIRIIGHLSQVYHKEMECGIERKNLIVTREDAKEFIRRKFIGRQKESFYLVCTSSKGRVLYSGRLFEGNESQVKIFLKDIARAAVASEAEKVVIAHNHPLGLSLPSQDDIRTTEIIKSELGRLGIELFDHIIVGTDSVCSLMEIEMKRHS